MLFPPPVSQDKSRVVITGAGIVTAYGTGWDSNSQGFRTGKQAFREVTLFDVSRHRVKRAAEVDIPATLPSTRMTSRQSSRMERAAKLLLLAADEALQQAKWDSSIRTPIVLGTTSGGMTMGEDFFRTAISSPARTRQQATRVTHYLAQRQAMNLVDAYRFTGPITIIANACAAGANAVGHAWELVRAGRAERVLAGGYDALCNLVYSGFDSLQALSPTTCRPFDAKRDGLALGEGAAILTLESLASAEKRGATILAEIVGYGASTDSHHLTQPHPQGEAALKSMRMACAVAGLQPADISYINAHGTGTSLNDSSEAAAITGWKRGTGATPSVSSTKAGIGHLLGAAGAVEAVVCIMSLRDGWFPPMTTTFEPDPLVDFDLVTQPRQASSLYQYALSNSFGFGGANASLIFRRWA